jgi:hypothetical protein
MKNSECPFGDNNAGCCAMEQGTFCVSFVRHGTPCWLEPDGSGCVRVAVEAAVAEGVAPDIILLEVARGLSRSGAHSLARSVDRLRIQALRGVDVSEHRAEKDSALYPGISRRDA